MKALGLQILAVVTLTAAYFQFKDYAIIHTTDQAMRCIMLGVIGLTFQLLALLGFVKLIDLDKLFPGE